MLKLINNKTFQSALFILTFVLLVFFPIFLNINYLPLYKWDESRPAINAYEMFINHNWLITYFQGKPDLWNTKPPLMIWMQVFFYKTLGVNELSARLPSALASFGICIFLFWLAIKHLKSYAFAFICTLLLITSNAYIGHHMSRTGDYETLLTLFSLGYIFSWYFYLESKNYKYIYATFLFLILAVLTKGIAGLLLIPTLFIWLIIKKETLRILQNKHLYIGLASFLSLTIGYYFLRELHNPGFLHTIYLNELGGRYFDSIEGHKESFWFYFEKLKNHQLANWFLLIPFGIIAGFLNKDIKIKQLTVFISIAIIQFFLVISFSVTKLEWYDTPLLPLIAIINGFAIFTAYNYLRNSAKINKYLKCNFIPLAFLIAVFSFPYLEVLGKTKKTIKDNRENGLYDICYYMREASSGKRNINNYVICYSEYQSQNIFYLNMLKEKNVLVKHKNVSDILENEVVFANQKTIINQIDSLFESQIIDSLRTVKVFKIGKKKVDS